MESLAVDAAEILMKMLGYSQREDGVFLMSKEIT